MQLQSTVLAGKVCRLRGRISGETSIMSNMVDNKMVKLPSNGQKDNKKSDPKYPDDWKRVRRDQRRRRRKEKESYDAVSYST